MQGTFYQFDADRSGTVEPHELNRALVAFGYNLSAPAQGAILRHFSTDGKISFDSFVACLIKLRILTSECCAIQQKALGQLSTLGTFDFSSPNTVQP